MAAAENPCSLAVLQERQGCLTCFSQSERLQIKVWVLGKILEELVGAIDFTQLNQDIACFACEPDSVLDAFELASLIDVAGLAGATLDGTSVADLTPAELKEATKCYPCANQKMLRAAKMWLWCRIMNLEAAPIVL